MSMSSSSSSSSSSQIQMSFFKSMNLIKPTTATAAAFFSVFISSCIVFCVSHRTTSWPVVYLAILPLVGAVLVVWLVVVVARATVVAWITVLVLLAFSGKRRRVLAKQGSRITYDVAIHAVSFVFQERGVVAVGCATFLSFVAMTCFTHF